MNLKELIAAGTFHATTSAEPTFGRCYQFQYIGYILTHEGSRRKVCICRGCSSPDNNVYLAYTSKPKCPCTEQITDQMIRCMSKTTSEYTTWPKLQSRILPYLAVKNAYKTAGRYDVTVICPTCLSDRTYHKSNLNVGYVGCDCSTRSNQKEAYINGIYSSGYLVAFKFGITSNAPMRVKQQNSKSVYDVVKHMIYRFPSVSSCKAAELECKQTLDCGIVSKEEMSDGYTETTHVYSLDKIIQIYKKHGGVLI